VRIIDGGKEMVEQIGADDTIDAFDAKTFGKLAQGKGGDGQILNGPVADRERRDPPILNLSMLSAGKGALHSSEFRDTKLPGEVRVERDLGSAGVSMKKVTWSPPFTRTLTSGSGSVFRNFRRVISPSPWTS
jgi:hypothetical protein